MGFLRNLVPGTIVSPAASGLPISGEVGREFENTFKKNFCRVLPPQLQENLFSEPLVNRRGKPRTNGITCAQFRKREKAPTFFDRRQLRRPDFIISPAAPILLKGRRGADPKGYLIGDFKVSWNALRRGFNSGQGRAMIRHARNYQYVPIVTYISAAGPPSSRSEAAFKAAYARKGIILVLITP